MLHVICVMLIIIYVISIYVNDVKAAVKCKLLLYADDSALLASSSDVSEIEEILKRKLESVS